jgi:beta-mannosidase
VGILSLSSLEWKLYGWRPFAWKLGKTHPAPNPIVPDINDIAVGFPMSVQQALRDGGLLPDWNYELDSRLCEWVEHRHWEYRTRLRLSPEDYGDKVVLQADGLDYSGWVLVDGEECAYFSGSMISHAFDLSERLLDGEEHELSFIFEEVPREQGQMGYTSRSRYFKSRYNYGWDWCPRIVPVGPWQDAFLLGADAWRKGQLFISTSLDASLQEGTVQIRLGREAGESRVGHYQVAVRDGAAVLAEKSFHVEEQADPLLTLSGLHVAPWYPNGAGKQQRYSLVVEERGADSSVLWREERSIGFKQIEWLPCEGAPEGATPWICSVNGQKVFLQGANWVPPVAVYHEAHHDDYKKLIDLYRDMGTNILRVWGGAILEKTDFYELCDEAGIFVWQEMPMSSSGVENCPPYDLEAIARLEEIATHYVWQRGHHVSLLLWSGGNELTWGGPEERIGEIPVDDRHPAIAAMRKRLEELDPQRRFVATSPTGPQFYSHPEAFGQGQHHDIHGPWGLAQYAGDTFSERLTDWKSYWEKDDALFRSEAGMPGASSLECLTRYASEEALWPPVNEYWLHTCAWWIQQELYEAEKKEGADDLAQYVSLTQKIQAEAYAVAARACKERFPRCGGFIIWMGHDCFPCPSNNSIIDFSCIPKPAYFALKEIFEERP